MSRRYQKVQELRPQIRQMLEQGMSQREVAESLESVLKLNTCVQNANVVN